MFFLYCVENFKLIKIDFIQSAVVNTTYNNRLEFAAEEGLWSMSSQHVQEPKLRAS